MSITDLKLSSLRKVVGDKDFVNETDVFPYATPIMARCYKSTDFQYKDANGELKQYFGLKEKCNEYKEFVCCYSNVA